MRQVQCPRCGKTIGLTDETVQVRCPDCFGVFTVKRTPPASQASAQPRNPQAGTAGAGPLAAQDNRRPGPTPVAESTTPARPATPQTIPLVEESAPPEPVPLTGPPAVSGSAPRPVPPDWRLNKRLIYRRKNVYRAYGGLAAIGLLTLAIAIVFVYLSKRGPFRLNEPTPTQKSPGDRTAAGPTGRGGAGQEVQPAAPAGQPARADGEPPAAVGLGPPPSALPATITPAVDLNFGENVRIIGHTVDETVGWVLGTVTSNEARIIRQASVTARLFDASGQALWEQNFTVYFLIPAQPAQFCLELDQERVKVANIDREKVRFDPGPRATVAWAAQDSKPLKVPADTLVFKEAADLLSDHSVAGEVVNSTGGPVFDACVRVELFDRQGRLLGSGHELAVNHGAVIEAEQTAQFTVDIPGNEVVDPKQVTVHVRAIGRAGKPAEQ